MYFIATDDTILGKWFSYDCKDQLRVRTSKVYLKIGVATIATLSVGHAQHGIGHEKIGEKLLPPVFAPPFFAPRPS